MVLFIAGIIFIECLMPVLNGFIEVFLVWVEKQKAKLSQKIASYNSDIELIKEATENAIDSKTGIKQAIGFAVPSEKNEEKEEYDDD